MNKDQDELKGRKKGRRMFNCCTCEKILEIASVFRITSTKKRGIRRKKQIKENKDLDYFFKFQYEYRNCVKMLKLKNTI